MTPLHFAAYKGVTGPLATLIENSIIIKIRADELGRSPIFYSILAKHQNTTDQILNILIMISEKCDFMNWASSFNSVKNDLPLIIKNSSVNLPNFLASCFYFKDELPITGIALIRAKFLPTINPDSQDFINLNAAGEKENLRIKACLFEIPASHGSHGSINLIRAILASSNKEIFNTQFIRFFIISKWQTLIKLIYLYGAILWINLALLVLLLSEVQLFWVYAVLFLVVNLVMLTWEYFRMKSGFLEYWMHFMSGFLTIFKCLVSIVWVVLLMAGIRFYELSWVVVFFNLLRGMAGFRTFDETRYYLQLIIQSTKSIRWFLLIYVYTTFSAGLLSVVVQDSINFTFQTLWMNPYALTAGDTDGMSSDSVNFKYLTFCITVFINVIVMLNMIISILGDSFDEFQLNAMHYDFKERTNVIFEIEQILGIFGANERFNYLHICVNSDEAVESTWRGKVLDLRLSIKETGKKVIQKVKGLEQKFTDNDEIMARIEGKVNGFEDKLKQLNSLVDERNSNLEKSIKDMKKGIDKILASIIK